MENWEDIKGYEGCYQVSDLGRIKSLQRYVTSRYGGERIVRERIRKTVLIKEYISIDLSVGGKRKTHRVHRLVATAFIFNPLNKPQINHKNGIKIDNRWFNLEWATGKENQSHAFRLGLNKGQKGEEHSQCKFNDIEIIAMRSVNTKIFNTTRICKTYEISSGNLSAVLNRKTWTHI